MAFAFQKDMLGDFIDLISYSYIVFFMGDSFLTSFFIDQWGRRYKE